MKTCSKCSTPTPDAEMTKTRATKDGLGAWCKPCHREYAKKRRAEDPSVGEKDRRAALDYRHQNLDAVRLRSREFMRDRQDLLDSLKTGPCTDCRRQLPPCCMDFDHVQGEKYKGVGKMLGYTKARLLAEVSKCELVCACCHRIRTADRHGEPKSLQRRAFYARLAPLKNHPCMDCGDRFPAVAMDFDHVRGEKIMSVAQMRAVAWVRVEAEIAKCDLVCANCHRIRTRARKQAA